jgi:serine/threonine-protein kinase HipA
MQHYDFKQITSYSYEQVFQTMRLLRLPYPQAEQMFRRMVFNVIARNCDDHTKNFAFRLKQGSEWELAPAYDICFAYRPDSVWVSQHNLSINGKRNNITKEDLLVVAKTMNIKKANNIIKQISETVAKWYEFAEIVNVDMRFKENIGNSHLIL